MAKDTNIYLQMVKYRRNRCSVFQQTLPRSLESLMGLSSQWQWPFKAGSPYFNSRCITDLLYLGWHHCLDLCRNLDASFKKTFMNVGLSWTPCPLLTGGENPFPCSGTHFCPRGRPRIFMESRMGFFFPSDLVLLCPSDSQIVFLNPDYSFECQISIITCLCDIYSCHAIMNSNSLCHKFFTSAPSLLASDHTPLSFFLWLSSLSPRLKRIKLFLIPVLSLPFVSNQSRILLGSISLICLCCSIPNASIPLPLPSSTSASMLLLTGFLVWTLSSYRLLHYCHISFFSEHWFDYIILLPENLVLFPIPALKVNSFFGHNPLFKPHLLSFSSASTPCSWSWLLTGSGLLCPILLLLFLLL